MDPMNSKKILASALGALALAATGALAQFDAPSPYSPPPPQSNQQPQQAPASPVCLRLEAQLASLDGQAANPQQQQLEATCQQQRGQMDQLTARSRSMGCGRNFLFGPRPAPECRGLENQIDRIRDQVERL